MALSLEEKRAVVEERYRELLTWFERNKTRSMVAYQICQVTTIVLSALTPVIVVVTDDKLAHALPPAVVAVAAAILSTFKFHETWLSRCEAAEALKSEYMRYLGQVGPDYIVKGSGTEDQAIAAFIAKIETINEQERGVWKAAREGALNDEAEAAPADEGEADRPA